MFARFDCLSIAKKPKVRHTRKAGPRDPRLEVMAQRQWSSRGRMGRHRRGGVCMEMLAAWSMHDTWKDPRATGVRPNSLWRVLTLDIIVVNAACRREAVDEVGDE